MKQLLSCLGFALVCLGGVACTGTDEAGDDLGGDEAVSQDELTTARVKSINVWRSTGFRPPPSPGSCHPSGSWTFNFETRALTGEACVASQPTAVDKVLSEADAKRVRVALSKVRVTARPPTCPTDMPVSSLQVNRAKSEVKYVDARASCGESSTPVREATLEGLVSLLEELSGPAAAEAPCVTTGCSGHICADEHRFSTCEWRPEYACYRAASCERGVDGHCGWRQTPDLAACLGN